MLINDVTNNEQVLMIKMQSESNYICLSFKSMYVMPIP